MTAARAKHEVEGPAPHAGLSIRAAVVVFLVAWLARGLHLALATRAGDFQGLFLDSRLYAESAGAIRSGAAPALGQAPYLLSPLYPLFLGLFPSMSEAAATNPALDVRIAQACIGALTCALAAITAGKLAGRRAGWIAGLLAASYAPAIHFDGMILVANLSALFLTGALAALVTSESASRPARWTFAAGLLLGCAACLRPTSLLVSAALATVLLLQRQSRPGKVVRAAALGLGSLLAIAPFWAQNARFGESFPLTAGGGFNFWVGNHTGADGTFQAPEGFDVHWDPVAKGIAEKALGRPVSYSRSSQFFFERTRDDIRKRPFDWVRLLAHKAWLFAHPVEIPQLGVSFAEQRRGSWPLRFPLDARWVLLLAFLAPVIRKRGPARPSLTFPTTMLWVFATGVVLFFVTARYRVPIMPVALVLAAVSLDQILRVLGGGRASTPNAAKRTGIGVGTLLLIGLLGFRSVPELPSAGIEQRHRGMSLLERGDFAQAERVLRAAIQTAPNPKTRIGLALALRGLHRDADARRELETALAMRPNDPDATFHLGVLMWETERNAGAARALFERALVARPGFADAYFNLGAVELASGEMFAASEAFERALELAPPDTAWRSEAERGLGLARIEIEKR